MTLTDFTDYIQSLTEYRVYPLVIPDGVSSEAVLIKLTGGAGNKRSDLVRMNLQIIVRANHPATAEAEANKLLKHFDDKTRFSIGNVYIIHATAQTPMPVFLQVDGLGNYKFNMNFTLLAQIKGDA